MFAPSEVPAPVLRRLSGDLADILATPDMKQRLRDLGMDPDPRGADAFGAYVKSESERYGAVLKKVGLVP